MTGLLVIVEYQLSVSLPPLDYIQAYLELVRSRLEPQVLNFRTHFPTFSNNIL